MCSTKTQFMSHLTFPMTVAPKNVHSNILVRIYMKCACGGAIASLLDVETATLVRIRVWIIYTPGSDEFRVANNVLRWPG